MNFDEQKRKHEELGPHWWVYEIFPELSKEECDEMIARWQAQIEAIDSHNKGLKKNDSLSPDNGRHRDA